MAGPCPNRHRSEWSSLVQELDRQYEPLENDHRADNRRIILSNICGNSLNDKPHLSSLTCQVPVWMQTESALIFPSVKANWSLMSML